MLSPFGSRQGLQMRGLGQEFELLRASFLGLLNSVSRDLTKIRKLVSRPLPHQFQSNFNTRLPKMEYCFIAKTLRPVDYFFAGSFLGGLWRVFRWRWRAQGFP
jgi:hypothetical protein